MIEELQRCSQDGRVEIKKKQVGSQILSNFNIKNANMMNYYFKGWI